MELRISDLNPDWPLDLRKLLVTTVSRQADDFATAVDGLVATLQAGGITETNLREGIEQAILKAIAGKMGGLDRARAALGSS